MKTVCAIAGIVLLDAWAIYNGIDGVFLITAIGIISGLGGYPVVQQLKDWYDVKVVKSFVEEGKK